MTTEATIATEYASRLGQDVSDFHRSFAQAVLGKDARALKFLANGLNKTGKKVFTWATGVKLPATQSATWKALRDWGGISDAQDAADAAARKAKIEASTAARELEWAQRTASHTTVRTTLGDVAGDVWVVETVAAGFDRLASVPKGAARQYHLVNAEGRGYRVSGALLDYAKAHLAQTEA